MSKPHGSVDVGNGTKTAAEVGRSMGDPTDGDREVDRANPSNARKEARAAELEGKHGKGARPVEGTSATNYPPTPGGLTCGNPYTGYGLCAGKIDQEAGRCTKCGIPTSGRIADAMASLHIDNADAGQLNAHEREAARLTITREVTAVVLEEMGWDPETAADQTVMTPQQKKKWAAVQREVDRRVDDRLKLAGLRPRAVA